MIILGLDPSTKAVGYAVLDTDSDAVLAHGTYKLRQDSLDHTLVDGYLWLERELDAWFTTGSDLLINAIAIEMPVKHRNVATTIKLAQMVGALRCAAFYWLETVIEVIPAERLTALGLPARMKREDAKEQVTRLVNWRYSLDLKPEDHDAADAVAVALAGYCKIRREGV